MRIDGVDVYIEGDGEQTLLMLHGWPDSHRIWDSTVDALKARFRCVRFTLPGFDLTQPPAAVSLAEMTATIARIAQAVSPGKAVTLVLHDWGCTFGYEFAAQHPELVNRMVAVDIGDHNTGHFKRSLSAKAKRMIMAYQMPLALAWKIGNHVSGALGNWLTRKVAQGVKCPAPAQTIGWQMNYPYAMFWFKLKGGLRQLVKVQPTCPLLFVYGERKPFMFHSPQWVERLNATAGSKAQGLPCGHWVMLEKPVEFAAVLNAWL